MSATNTLDTSDSKSAHASIRSIPESEPEESNYNIHERNFIASTPSLTAEEAGRDPPSPAYQTLPPSPPSTATKKASETPQTLGSGNSLPTRTWARRKSRSYADGYDGGALGSMREEDEIMRCKHGSFHEEMDEIFSDNEMRSKSRVSRMSDNFNNGMLMSPCATKNDMFAGRATWLSISILSLSIYSTAFSGIWLMLALVQPRYGRTIHSGGQLDPSTASTLITLIAKTIELSFVTVFVAFLGQVLSRRSLIKMSRGVSLAELSLRTWILQPGFIITHWKNVQHAGFTVLSAITLTTTLAAMFYTTASDALVSPQLKVGKPENKLMYGLVQASYANPFFISDQCQTPVSKDIDPLYAGTTCLAIEHSGEAYHDYLSYINTWADIRAQGIGASTNITQRPKPVATLYDNSSVTTVVGQWISQNTSNITANSAKYNRIINNVSMSMPHAGVFAAAHDKKNGILQPADLEGVGEYSLRASVVSPSINVLCVNANEEDLKPLVYVDAIPDQKFAWSGYENEVQLLPGQSYLNSTNLDDIFEWGPKYARNQNPPVFPMYPIDYNFITNTSVAFSDSIYLLFKAPKSITLPDNYTICQMRSYLSPNCTTQYNVSGTGGGHLQAICEDPTDPTAYSKSFDNATTKAQTDWRNVISTWALALALNTGVSNANASNARMLSQFIQAPNSKGVAELNTLMPSIAEALAALAGSTLLLSSKDATFYDFWNYDYTSGGNIQPWQEIFYAVLLLVFATNVFCLGYFILRSGLATDYTEPPNLFALAINSPPSAQLNGSCGAGPADEQLNVDWHILQDDNTSHVYIREASDESKMRKRQTMSSVSSYNKLSSRKTFWL